MFDFEQERTEITEKPTLSFSVFSCSNIRAARLVLAVQLDLFVLLKERRTACHLKERNMRFSHLGMPQRITTEYLR